MTTHGTYGGYQIHVREGTAPCEECRQANRDYMKTYRQSNPDTLIRDRQRAKIRNRALVELAKRHRREFQKILEEMS